MIRPIAISLSPNTQVDDLLLALRIIFSPWRWFKKDGLNEINGWFDKSFPDREVFLFNSARAALFELLKAAGIGENDEVLVQAFTCVAVPNSVVWSKAKPVFVDCDETFNIDVKDLEKKITKKTRVLIIQHTFGIPADIKKITTLAKKHNLFVFEDCAHSLGALVNGKKVGSFADAAFFSFGRDKVISSVFGGTAVVKNKMIASNLSNNYNSLVSPNWKWICQQLFHPIAFNFIILPLYNLGVGKWILVQLQSLQILSKAVYPEEKMCKRPVIFPAKFPNALAIFAFNQLKKLEAFNAHRQKIAKMYLRELKNIQGIVLPPKVDGAIWLRFPILTDKRQELLSFAKQNGILLGDWYDAVTPKESLDCIGYVKRSCPKAEEYAQRCVNLPTYPLLPIKDVKRVIQLIERFSK